MANCDSSRPRVIFARAFAQALVSAGVITQEESDRTRRIVIDAVAGQPVRLYLERFGDERLLVAALGLNGIEVHAGTPSGQGDQHQRSGHEGHDDDHDGEEQERP